jgi:hypothetical protein
MLEIYGLYESANERQSYFDNGSGTGRKQSDKFGAKIGECSGCSSRRAGHDRHTKRLTSRECLCITENLSDSLQVSLTSSST